MAKKSKNQDIKKEDLEKYLDYQGQKLGYLISKSNLPKESKLELVDFISHMELKDVMELVDVLENQYADKKTKDIDKEYGDKLKEIFKKNKENRKKLDEELVDNLKKLNINFKLEDI